MARHQIYSHPRRNMKSTWSAGRMLSTEPWRINAALDPILKVLDQVERTGTIDSARGEAVFRDTGDAIHYSFVPAVQGLVGMFELAAQRKGWALDLTALTRLANKLHVGCPLVQSDLDTARQAIEQIRKHAMRLTLGEANDVLTTWRIGEELRSSGGVA